MKCIHLICNAHLDPVWQWDWNEGAAAAISTFRVAAELCEEFDFFVFNHNEALLYEWVLEYDPPLFERIKKLVKEGRWEIIGGWYLQPDCNLPAGESIVRQILKGRMFFKRHFGKEPKTAVNFDSFGHSPGLVQILKKSGYDGYLFMRPDHYRPELKDMPMLFCWQGFAGSEISAVRIDAGYNTQMGHAVDAIRNYVNCHSDRDLMIRCWGIGDHGGGPSRLDLERLREYMSGQTGLEVLNSTPDRFMSEVDKASLPKLKVDLNPIFVGCYISMAEVKRLHRKLENELYVTEKMCSQAAIRGMMDYPSEKLDEAVKDLLFSEFHDALPGSGTRSVEEAAVRQLNHGLEICSKLSGRAFFIMSGGEKAVNDRIPVLVYNPHPYEVADIFECEYMLADQNYSETYTVGKVFRNGAALPSQLIKEDSCLNLDWRKKIAFSAALKPCSMNRFDIELELLPSKPALPDAEGDTVTHKTDSFDLVISKKTGLFDRFTVNGHDFAAEGFGTLSVYRDNEDPWRMDVMRIDDFEGDFRIMTVNEMKNLLGKRDELEPVRIIEDGEVFKKAEICLIYGHSYAVIDVTMPYRGSDVKISIKLFNHERNRLIRYNLATGMTDGTFCGQTMFGVNNFGKENRERPFQKWAAVYDSQKALAVVNDGIYSGCFSGGVLGMNLLRSPVYCAHPVMERELVPGDRYLDNIDIGERTFNLWLTGGKPDDVFPYADGLAQLKNERPYVLQFFPDGGDACDNALLTVTDARVDAIKKCESGDGYILRIFNGKAKQVTAAIKCDIFEFNESVELKPYEVKTFRFDRLKFDETDLMEETFYAVCDN